MTSHPTGPDAPEPDPHDPDTTGTAPDVEDPVAAEVEAMIEEAVASLPEFTPEQRERLRRLLNPPYRTP